MTRRMRARLCQGFALGTLASAALIGVSPTTAQADTEVTGDLPATATAVAVFTVDPYEDVDPLPADLATALQRAEDRAELNADTMAAPYADRAADRVVLPVTTSNAARAAATITVDTAALQDDGTDDESIPGEESVKTDAAPEAQAPSARQESALPKYFYPATPRVKYSLAALTAVQDEVLTADLPGADKMYTAAVDAATNRVVIEASAVTEEMRTALASRYGADKVALRLTPGEDAGGAQASRNNDTTPFYGGAKLGPHGCTIGFPWTVGTAPHFLTAGHCTSAGQNIYTTRYCCAVGKVVADNWNNSSGSVKINGASYSGDLSLVKMNSGYSTAAYMYTGGPTSNTFRKIDGVSSRSPKYGDTYCTGGSTKGTVCGWKVSGLRMNVKYSGGYVARNMTRGGKRGHCTAPGDSGGPVFTINAGGLIVAKGIHSGGGGGGSDHYTGALEPACREWFTDIRVAEGVLPGLVRRF